MLLAAVAPPPPRTFLASPAYAEPQCGTLGSQYMPATVLRPLEKRAQIISAIGLFAPVALAGGVRLLPRSSLNTCLLPFASCAFMRVSAAVPIVVFMTLVMKAKAKVMMARWKEQQEVEERARVLRVEKRFTQLREEAVRGAARRAAMSAAEPAAASRQSDAAPPALMATGRSSTSPKTIAISREYDLMDFALASAFASVDFATFLAKEATSIALDALQAAQATAAA